MHLCLYERLATRRLDDITAALDALAGALGVAVPQPDGRPLTTEELVDLADHPLITIGGHTVSHPRLAELPLAESLVEIEVGLRELGS